MPRCALDDEEDAFNREMRQKIRAALDDPRADIPAEEVFARLRALKADPDGA
jgi:antitoxin ParD1/3/4